MSASPLNLAAILAILALLLGVYNLWQAVSLNRMRKIFFAGSTALDLESVILRLEQELQSMGSHQVILEQELDRVKHQLGFAVQKVGLVRFNPFDDGGGNFS